MKVSKILLFFALLAQFYVNFATIESHAEKIGIHSSCIASQFLPSSHQNSQFFDTTEKISFGAFLIACLGVYICS